VTYLFKLWDLLYISGTVEARNFKFGTQIGQWGLNDIMLKLVKMDREGVT